MKGRSDTLASSMVKDLRRNGVLYIKSRHLVDEMRSLDKRVVATYNKEDSMYTVEWRG